MQGYSWGEGEKLAFLSHGWNGRAANLSAYVEPLLARGYRVLALDAPGHGESEGTICNAPRYAKCWLAVEEEYGSPQAMVCHSFGAMACTVAQKWNLSVEKAVYLGPLSDIPKRFREFCRLCQFSDAETEEMLSIARKHFSEFVLEDFNGDVAAKNFTSQGLIIHDDQDQEADWAEGKAIADAWPNAQMFTASGLGHFRILRSQLVIKTVMDFLER
ncbi:MAG: alpha/beta hydrolase [Fimbriimonadaceae bacterium]